MKDHFKQFSWFYIPYLVILLVGIGILLQFTKGELHIWMNKHNNPCCDFFFKYLTNLGDGIVLPVLILPFLFKNYRLAILLVISFLLSGLVVQVLKHTMFEDVLRPVAYFGDTYKLHLVEGVKNHMHNSFPSGHSASAFAFGLSFAILFKSKTSQVLMFVMACLIAFSRIYLSQHFFVDALAGSLIGVVCTSLSYFALQSLTYEWLDKRLILKRK